MSRTTRDLIQNQHEPGRAPRTTLTIAAMLTANGPARFLGEALASVRAQTASPTEIVVLDDTSPGAGAAQLAEAAGAKLVRHRLGANIARNVAILESQQDWIALIDSDDVWVPHKLETQ